MYFTQYSIGFLFGVTTIICLAFIHEGGAQDACRSLYHSKCELVWKPIEPSKVEHGE